MYRTYAANCRRGILPHTTYAEMHKSVGGASCPALKCVSPDVFDFGYTFVKWLVVYVFPAACAVYSSVYDFIDL